MQFIPSTWAIYGADANGDGAGRHLQHQRRRARRRPLPLRRRRRPAHPRRPGPRRARLQPLRPVPAQVLALADAYRRGIRSPACRSASPPVRCPRRPYTGYIPPANPGARPPSASIDAQARAEPVRHGTTTAATRGTSGHPRSHPPRARVLRAAAPRPLPGRPPAPAPSPSRSRPRAAARHRPARPSARQFTRAQQPAAAPAARPRHRSRTCTLIEALQHTVQAAHLTPGAARVPHRRGRCSSAQRAPAASASIRRPVTSPPVRSPLVNEARMASAASAQARFGSRSADSGPVTMCSDRWPGDTATSTDESRQPLEQRLGVRPRRRLELADVDGEDQAGLPAGQRQRLVEPAELGRR